MYHDDDLLDDNATSPVVGWRPSTLRKKRLTGDGPPYHKIGGLVRYRFGTLREWLAKREVTSTAQGDQLSKLSKGRQA